MTHQRPMTIEKMHLQFKASFFPCTVLQLLHYDLGEINNQLLLTIKRAPNLFKGSFVVVDIEKLNAEEILNFERLKQMVVQNGMIPIAIRGGSGEQQQAALIDGWALLPVSRMTSTETEKNQHLKQTTISTKLVTQAVRSGMQVYAEECDLIVTASVSPGAEIFSDGNIHVYGILRGRALAGVRGNVQARIFCRSLEAELVSIAGYYLTKEDMQPFIGKNEMIQIYLENEKVRIEAI